MIELANVQDEQGTTMAAHLENMRRQTGVTPPELLPVPCLPEVKYLWNYWLSMNARRQEMMPISHSEIQAWSNLRGVHLSVFEVEVLDKIEALYFKYHKPWVPPTRK